MKILVLAQTPPPVHGQSAMVQTLLEVLRTDKRFEVQHVNLSLSSDAGEIGRWRFGKIAATWRAARKARRLLGREKNTWLYYVPAPGKLGALLRDFLVMALCRSRARGLVLHWHAAGLGSWLRQKVMLRALVWPCVARPELSVVLARELATDAAEFQSKDVAIVANGIDVPQVARATREGVANSVRPDLGQAGATMKNEIAPRFRYDNAVSNRLDQGRALRGAETVNVLFLGLCSRAKGLFSAMEAVALANAKRGEEASGVRDQVERRFQLKVAGSFASPHEQAEFQARAAALGEAVNFVGFADDAQKRELWAQADIFIFPTRYPHEAMPLTLIEAMAHGVSIVTTRWRAIPGILPERGALCVEPGEVMALSAALGEVERGPEARAALRAHYEKHFTRAAFGRAMTEALLRAEKERGA